MIPQDKELVGLKPCPFCGETDHIRQNVYIRDGRAVVCKCGASVHSYAPDANARAVEFWNTRSSLTTQQSNLQKMQFATPTEAQVEAVARSLWLNRTTLPDKEQRWLTMLAIDRESYFSDARCSITAFLSTLCEQGQEDE